jgi:hypothetical protein
MSEPGGQRQQEKARSPSDEIRIGLREIGVLRACTKQCAGLITTFCVVFSIIAQIPIPPEGWWALIIILSGIYGLDGAANILQSKNGRR